MDVPIQILIASGVPRTSIAKEMLGGRSDRSGVSGVELLRFPFWDCR